MLNEAQLEVLQGLYEEFEVLHGKPIFKLVDEVRDTPGLLAIYQSLRDLGLIEFRKHAQSYYWIRISEKGLSLIQTLS